MIIESGKLLKYLFIINPKSGKGKAEKTLVPLVEDYFNKNKGNYEIILTSKIREATDIAKTEALKGGKLRIYACGGDGTLFDVVNGIANMPSVEVGAIPCGSGNDFIKTFGDARDFFDIEGQVKGSSFPIDLIKANEFYSINVCSVGMDAEVANHKNNMKILSGSAAYTAAVFKSLLFNIKNRFTITVDGLSRPEKDYLFAVAANARYYGGSYMPAPDASPNDGLIDCVFINSVSRLKIISLLSAYKKGKHVNMPEICETVRAKSMTVESTAPLNLNVDGEIFAADKSVEFFVVPKGVRFILPSTCAVKLKDEKSDAVSLPGVFGTAPACELDVRG